jgi:hypothetical protein
MAVTQVDEECELETTMAPEGAIVVFAAWIAAAQASAPTAMLTAPAAYAASGLRRSNR